jgi:hypothetical protein
MAEFIGPELKGRDKWLGGELGGDGNIYGVSLETLLDHMNTNHHPSPPFPPYSRYGNLRVSFLV